MRRPALIRLLPTALVLVGALVAGYTTAPTTSHPNPIRLEHGVPIGVSDTPIGAVAAADNYLAAEDESLLSADQLRRVVNTDWAPRERSVELAQPFPAAALAGKTATFAGLELTAAVAAQRLESYTPQSAEVGVWHEVTIWSSTVEPAQRWSLDTITLVWDSGQWLVASRSPAPDSQTPVPSWTSGGPTDRTSGAFDARLSGMSAPYYGAMP